MGNEFRLLMNAIKAVVESEMFSTWQEKREEVLRLAKQQDNAVAFGEFMSWFDQEEEQE